VSSKIGHVNLSDGTTYCEAKTKAREHFYSRFTLRGVDKLISLDELENCIEQCYTLGKFFEDKKHPGIEGPRYRISIPKRNKEIIVIVEKTKNCLLPITVWFENI